MINQLKKLLDKAYAPYSGVNVAAILKTRDGKFFDGVNVENSAYPSGICAERSAIFACVSNGYKPGDIAEIHITSNLDRTLYPCAGCLQVMSEFFDVNTKIYIYGVNEIKEHFLSDLLPYAVVKESFGWK